MAGLDPGRHEVRCAAGEGTAARVRRDIVRDGDGERGGPDGEQGAFDQRVVGAVGQLQIDRARGRRAGLDQVGDLTVGPDFGRAGGGDRVAETLAGEAEFGQGGCRGRSPERFLCIGEFRAA